MINATGIKRTFKSGTGYIEVLKGIDISVALIMLSAEY